MKKAIFTSLILFLIGVSVTAQKNNISLIAGFGGGDGVTGSFQYGIEYGRSVSPVVEVYGKYNQFLQSDKNIEVEEKNLLEISKSSNPRTRFHQFRSYGLGALLHINRTENASLYLIVGGRYKKQNSTSINGIQSGTIIKVIEVDNSTAINYELGIGYRREFASKYIYGGRLSLLNPDTKYSFSAMFGMKF